MAEFDTGLDRWIRAVQAIGLLSIVATVVAAWSAWQTLIGPHSLGTKIWSIIVALAMVQLAWFSLAFGLISIDLNY
ncbi:hypothetical protein CAI21_08845 [Alkalilimnicola ehrlichii]|uniref:Uncharacterized protein n=1 Tax=Alkalilimnicola ehrlichii TaxID=351052 RepID=A0A3E0WWG8_9GAMM|nr:hypothetical protein [Alkalilimnicola ehrlichii]RFA29923.1 hypothetical protein CAI21_08845 [Alkalilimnicola ehrlichii]RFA36511.1 hypothetical protein CAL65_11120 [Alkalilimnicola ehrlichii]